MSHEDEKGTGQNGNPESALATEVEKQPATPPQTTSVEARPFEFLLDIPLELKVEMGRKTITMGELMKLTPGSVIELNRPAGDQLDIFANGRLVARAEAVVVGDRYGVRILEILGVGTPGPDTGLSEGGAS